MGNNREDRLKIQTELSCNMVIEAGAGTGKTSLLIRRLCLAILAQHIPVEKIVALTFTEAAAAEIKKRLVGALHEVVWQIRHPQPSTTPPDPDNPPLLDLLQTYFKVKPSDLLDRAEAALDRLDRASLGTIHSFCADILKTFPLEAGLSPQAEIDAGPRAEQLFEARWNTFLDEELGVQAPRRAVWKKILPEISLPQLKQFVRLLCSGKIEKYDYFAQNTVIAALCEEKARQALAWSSAFLPKPASKKRKTEMALSWAAESLRRSAAFLRKQPLPPAPEEEVAPWTATRPSGWDELSFAQAHELYAFACKLIPQRQEIFLQIYDLVNGLAQQIRADYAREGILSFDDLVVKTRNLLQHDLYVRRLLKEKFDVLFIDEFQDTDPVQGEIFLFLAEEKTSSATRWQEVRLTPGKLVVVGDPKQSIYRFRGADITAYELFTDLILRQHGQKCFLQQNFRSVPDIVQTANAVCSRAMVQETAFQPAYVPIYPHATANGPAVEWLFVCGDESNPTAESFRYNQAEQIARWIKKNVGIMKLSDGKVLSYEDITLLFRAGTKLSIYTEALRRHDIAFNVALDKDFYRKQEIDDFVNLLRVLADPSDRTALAGVLRSPWGGLTDGEIYQLAKRGELSLQARTTHPQAAHCYKMLNEWVVRAGHTALDELVHSILQTSFFAEACAAAYEGEQTLAALQRLAELAENCAQKTPVSLGQFVAVIEAAQQEIPGALAAETLTHTGSAVSVMTVHKSKGLGLPVVIFADLSKQEGGQRTASNDSIFSWQYNMYGLRAGKFCDAHLAFLEEEQKKHERCEETRILYVALTRAREHLVLVGDARAGAEKSARAFAAAGLFPDGTKTCLTHETLTLPVQNTAFQAPETFLYKHETVAQPAVDLSDLAAWQQHEQARQARYRDLLASPAQAPSQRVADPAQPQAQQEEAMELGSLCHAVLEYLLKNRSYTVVQAVEQVLRQGESTATAQALCALVEPFVHTALWGEICACRVLACEMPFCATDTNGQFVRGVMDVVLECADKTIWVIDYKTNRLPPGGTETLRALYAPQLTVYQAAAKQIFAGKKVRCSAVFIRLGSVLDI